MNDYDVRVTYAKEGTDDRHKSSGIVFYIEDVTKFQNKEYVKPVIIDNKLYFELSDTFQGRGNYIKLTNFSGSDKKSSVRRRIKKVSSDLDYIRQFVPYVGTHTLNWDYEKKQYYINPINVEDNSLPLFMLPKEEYKHAEKMPKKTLSDAITDVLVQAGMKDKIEGNTKIDKPEPKQVTTHKELMLADLSAKDLSDLIYKAVYSAQLHAFINMQKPVKLQYEQLLEDIESISERYVFNHDIYVRKDEVLDIVNNLRK